MRTTKLEQKLLELGYKHYYKSYNEQSYFFSKDVNDWQIVISCDYKITKIKTYYITKMRVGDMWELDLGKETFNQLQNDLEVLREYE